MLSSRWGDAQALKALAAAQLAGQPLQVQSGPVGTNQLQLRLPCGAVIVDPNAAALAAGMCSFPCPVLMKARAAPRLLGKPILVY